LDEEYCQSDCEASLASCNTFIQLLIDSGQIFGTLLSQSCDTLNDNVGCVNSGTAVAYAVDEPICPDVSLISFLFFH